MSKEQNQDASTPPRYSMLIQWSDEDQQYVVTFPEWEVAGWRGHTGAKNYEAAAKRGRNMIENYIMWTQEDGKPLPHPNLFAYTDDDEDETSEESSGEANTEATAQSR